MSRTVLRASFRSRAIALIFRFCTKYARRTLAIVSTVTIPLLTPGANQALGAGLPPGGGVKFGRRSPPKRGQNCTPLNKHEPPRATTTTPQPAQLGLFVQLDTSFESIASEGAERLQ